MADSNMGQEGRAPGWRAALFGLCPVCAAPTLFDGPIHFSGCCRACGADFGGQNVGDGPAAFLTLIVGGLVLALAMTVEFWLYPPFWVHIILWVPFTIGAVLLGLRGAKGWLFHAEWQRRAGEGRIDHD
jgi:uncharacterized protein (DUF983 family)